MKNRRGGSSAAESGVVEYYKDIPEVKCYEEGVEAESDSDEE